MTEIFLRKLANWILNSALACSSPMDRPWAEAMLGELTYVRSGLSAVWWAVGGFSVLLRRAALNLVKMPSPGFGPGFSPSVLVKEGMMRKITTILAGVSVMGSLSFLLAPTFRQAVRVSLAGWQETLPWATHRSDRILLDLAAESRRRQDPELMAFVALRLWNNPESNELAKQAVRLNPSLTWVYSIFSNPYHQPADAKERIRELENWDPQNGYPYLVEAEQIFVARHSKNYDYTKDGVEIFKDDPQWFEAMAAAFRAPKYDSYYSRQLDLDRSVMRRYQFQNPMVIFGAFARLYGPSIQIYSEYLISLGKDYEKSGDLKRARESFLSVAHFCQLVQLNAQTDIEPIFVNTAQRNAYQGLKSIAEKTGDSEEAGLLAYEIGHMEQQVNRFTASYRALWPVYQWHAVIVQSSTLVLLFSVTLIITSVGVSLASRRVSQPQTSLWRKAAAYLRTVGAFGLLMATLTLYVGFQPYAESFQTFMNSSGGGRFRPLDIFADLSGGSYLALPILRSHFLIFYFWSGIILVLLLALMFVVVRHFRKVPHLHPVT